MSEYFATHIIQVGVPQIKTLDDIGLASTSATKLTLSKAFRPGTFDHTSSPPVSSIIESTVDGMPYWIDSGGTPAALGTASGSWQPLDADLTAIAGLSSSSNTAPYFTGSGTAALMTVTTAGRALLDDADTSAMRTTLGLVIGTNVQAYDADLTSLAAATGTNTIYYRSASDTWSAVTVGSGLTFTGGTLDAAGGAATWGAIVGTLSDQTDLQAELDALQPLDADLTALAGLTSASDTAPYFTGSGTAALMTVTTAARDLLDDADAAAMRTTLGITSGGDVDGPASSVDAEVALFDSTTGKLLKRASVTGIATLTSGVLSTVTAPSGTIVGTTDTQTLTAKTLTAPIIATISNTGTITLPTSTDTLVGRATTDTLTNKRVTKRVGTTASNSTITIDSDAYDDYVVTALATAATIAAPTGTPTDRQRLVIQIKDNGTARALTFNSVFRIFGTTLPTTTVLGKLMAIGCIWDAADSKWNVMVVSQEA